MFSEAVDADNAASEATAVREKKQGVYERSDGRPIKRREKLHKTYTAALEQEVAAIKRAEDASNSLSTEIENNKNTTNRLNDEIKELTRSEKTNSKAKDQSSKKTKKSTSDLHKFNRAVSGAGKAAKKYGGGGGFGGFGKSLGKIGGAALVAVTAISAVGTAISGFIADLAQKAKEDPIKSGDAGTAAKSAGEQAQAEGFGELFTLGGAGESLLESIRDPASLLTGDTESGRRRQKNI